MRRFIVWNAAIALGLLALVVTCTWIAPRLVYHTLYPTWFQFFYPLGALALCAAIGTGFRLAGQSATYGLYNGGLGQVAAWVGGPVHQLSQGDGFQFALTVGGCLLGIGVLVALGRWCGVADPTGLRTLASDLAEGFNRFRRA